jgi:hypothetical protein
MSRRRAGRLRLTVGRSANHGFSGLFDSYRHRGLAHFRR